MEDEIFNHPDYFKSVPKHLQKKYEKMVIDELKTEIANGLDIEIRKKGKHDT